MSHAPLCLQALRLENEKLKTRLTREARADEVLELEPEAVVAEARMRRVRRAPDFWGIMRAVRRRALPLMPARADAGDACGHRRCAAQERAQGGDARQRSVAQLLLPPGAPERSPSPRAAVGTLTAVARR